MSNSWVHYRLSRSLLDFSVIFECFDRNNVDLIAVDDSIDTSTAMGRAQLGILMVFAQLERETIQQRIVDNYKYRAENGMYLGGKPPLGYDKVEFQVNGKKTYKYAENEAEAELIKLIFDMYNSDSSKYGLTGDMSIGKIVKYLNTETEHRTTRGKTWGSNTISRILRNPAYTQADVEVYEYFKAKGYTINNDVTEFGGKNGIYHYKIGGKKGKLNFSGEEMFVTIAPHEGLIPSYKWLQVQSKLDNNRQIKNNGKGKHSWLSGLMKCPECGYAVTVVNSRHAIKSNQKFKLTCGGRKKNVCNDRTEPLYLEDIEAEVEAVLHDYILNDVIPQIGEVNEEKIENNAKLNALRMERAKLNEQVENLMESIMYLDDSNKVSAMKLYTKQLMKLNGKIENIEDKINKIKGDITERSVRKEDVMNAITEWGSFSIEEKKIIAKAFIKRVTVTESEIQVFFI